MKKGLLPWHIAPTESVIDYFMHPLYEQACQEIWPGLERGLDRFDIVGCIPTCEGPAFLMRDREAAPGPWCVKRRGDNGRYFRDFRSMAAYIFAVVNCQRTDQRCCTALVEAYRRHWEDG